MVTVMVSVMVTVTVTVIVTVIVTVTAPVPVTMVHHVHSADSPCQATLLCKRHPIFSQAVLFFATAVQQVSAS